MQKYKVRDHLLVLDKGQNEWTFCDHIFWLNPLIGDNNKRNKESLRVSVGFKDKIDELILESILDDERTIEELVQEVNSKAERVVDRDLLLKRLKKFESIGIVGQYEDDRGFSPTEIQRYNRQMRLLSAFGDKYQFMRQLKNAKVVLIGVGGLGTVISYYLAAAGVGHLIAYDFDRVELSNLNRQMLYKENDVGKLKTEVAAEWINKFNPHIKYEAYPVEITKQNFVQYIDSSANVVIVTVHPIEDWINEYCVKNGISIIVPRNTIYSPCGARTVVPFETPCFECIRLQETESRAKCDVGMLNKCEAGELQMKLQRRYEAPTLGPIVGICASIMAMEVIKIITGIKGKEWACFSFDPLEWRMDKENFEKRSDCPVCGGK